VRLKAGSDKRVTTTPAGVSMPMPASDQVVAFFITKARLFNGLHGFDRLEEPLFRM
jgi:hypothetical protein